jgi:hypothetical protein
VTYTCHIVGVTLLHSHRDSRRRIDACGRNIVRKRWFSSGGLAAVL